MSLFGVGSLSGLSQKSTDQSDVDADDLAAAAAANNLSSMEVKILANGDRECDFDKDPTRLYKAIQKRDWGSAIKLAQGEPEEALTWVSRKEKDGRLRWRLLPLHSAVIFKAPDNVVESLLCAFPKGAQCKDDQGMLPVHLAFRHGSSEEVVNLLLVAYPQSIDVKDRKGRIPLELAQASASPNKDAFIRALERGPSYYAVAAAATERAAVTAEQRAIFDAKLIEVRNTHKHEMVNLVTEHDSKTKELQEQVLSLSQELEKTKETSQVLVDHVSSLEAQLSSRSDTERFLATKIATLDSTLKEEIETKEKMELELRSELEKLTRENGDLQSACVAFQQSDSVARRRDIEKTDRLAKENSEYEKKLMKNTETIQLLEADIIGYRNEINNMEVVVKSKNVIEQTLATQVSTLAARLAESASDSSTAASMYTKRIDELEDERSRLRATVKSLTDKLALVATCLDGMTVEQEGISQRAADHEKTMSVAAKVHVEILEDARRQREMHESAQKERAAIAEILKRQDDDQAKMKEENESLMKRVVEMNEEMNAAHKDREGLVLEVVQQRLDLLELINTAVSLLPKGVKNEDEFINLVVRQTMDMKDTESTDQETYAQRAVDDVLARSLGLRKAGSKGSESDSAVFNEEKKEAKLDEDDDIDEEIVKIMAEATEFDTSKSEESATSMTEATAEETFKPTESARDTEENADLEDQKDVVSIAQKAVDDVVARSLGLVQEESAMAQLDRELSGVGGEADSTFASKEDNTTETPVSSEKGKVLVAAEESDEVRSDEETIKMDDSKVDHEEVAPFDEESQEIEATAKGTDAKNESNKIESDEMSSDVEIAVSDEEETELVLIETSEHGETGPQEERVDEEERADEVAGSAVVPQGGEQDQAEGRDESEAKEEEGSPTGTKMESEEIPSPNFASSSIKEKPMSPRIDAAESEEIDRILASRSAV